jgi:arylsulfatase A-like enzyme
LGDWCGDDACPEAVKRWRQEWSIDLIPPEVIREARAAYYGLITQIDYNMGRVFSALQDLGIFDDTLILYSSDHGEMLGDQHCGAKATFYEPSAHVPFVLRLPKSWENRCHGTENRQLVTHADILPTLLAAAGGTIPDAVDGQDLIALARGELAEPRKYLEATSKTVEYFAITDGRWKYIYYPEGAVEHLFDIQTDPSELNNLAEIPDFEDRKTELRAELIRRHEERGSDAIRRGEWISKPLRADGIRDRRNSAWPGYHTERYKVDVRH